MLLQKNFEAFMVTVQVRDLRLRELQQRDLLRCSTTGKGDGKGKGGDNGGEGGGHVGAGEG